MDAQLHEAMIVSRKILRLGKSDARFVLRMQDNQFIPSAYQVQALSVITADLWEQVKVAKRGVIKIDATEFRGARYAGMVTVIAALVASLIADEKWNVQVNLPRGDEAKAKFLMLVRKFLADGGPEWKVWKMADEQEVYMAIKCLHGSNVWSGKLIVTSTRSFL